MQKGNNGEACSTSDECGSGLCYSFVCTAKGASGTNFACEGGWQCQSGLCGYSDKHLRFVCYSDEDRPAASACDVDGECLSNDCALYPFGWVSAPRVAEGRRLTRHRGRPCSGGPRTPRPSQAVR